VGLELFSWGYWGWGNATERLVEAFDIAEQARGFRESIFVDCRIKRQGLAKGFVGDAFRDLVGPSRYCWMDDLGNEAVAKGISGVEIKNEAAVVDLLRLAQQAATDRRRVLFYCACEFPSLNGNLACHRLRITELLLKRAEDAGQPLTVVEWPGGELLQTGIKAKRELFALLASGTRKSIPFARNRLAEFASLPWASIATIERDGDGATCDVLVGPARFASSTNAAGYWYLPVIEPSNRGATKELLRETAMRWRRSHGLEPRYSR
jgi:hypothetical protein